MPFYDLLVDLRLFDPDTPRLIVERVFSPVAVAALFSSLDLDRVVRSAVARLSGFLSVREGNVGVLLSCGGGAGGWGSWDTGSSGADWGFSEVGDGLHGLEIRIQSSCRTMITKNHDAIAGIRLCSTPVDDTLTAFMRNAIAQSSEL